MTLDEIMASIPQELQFNADVAMEHFNVLDTNGDGWATAAEMRFHLTEGHQAPSQADGCGR